MSGRAISNVYVDYVKIACPKGAICMDAWFKWSINVAKTLSGPLITGHVTAMQMQHTTVIPSYERRLRSFVLKPIVDPRQRALLRSRYYLLSTSFARPTEPPSAQSPLPNEIQCMVRVLQRTPRVDHIRPAHHRHKGESRRLSSIVIMEKMAKSSLFALRQRIQGLSKSL